VKSNDVLFTVVVMDLNKVNKPPLMWWSSGD